MPKFVFLPPQSEITRGWAATLAQRAPAFNVVVAETPDEARQQIVDADAAFGALPADVLRQARQLKWLQAPAIAPPAGFYYPELIEHPVVVTNQRGIFNEHIAAHIMAFVLAFARGFHRYIPRQLRHEWAPDRLDSGVVHLPESTALIVGVGGIGAEAARNCTAFGMRVIGVDARLNDRPQDVSELHPPEQLDEVLPRADFVILTIPHTPETEGLMDAARFARMKPTAFFINIGRGKTTRLHDLVDALQSGKIAGAGPGRLRRGAAAGRPPAVGRAECAAHSAHGRLRTVPGRSPAGDPAGQRQRFLKGEPLRNVVDKAHWF